MFPHWGVDPLSFIFYTVSLILFYNSPIGKAHKPNWKLVHEWKQIEFKFANEEERSQAIENGTFNVGKLQPIDAQYTFNAKTSRERIFITTPREDVGYPATLGVISNEVRDGNPVIEPYPSWSWHINPEECKYNRLISVFRVWVDECNKLWIIDNGIIGDKFTCKPQLLAFDLDTDKLMHRYEIPDDQYSSTSWYITLVVEVEDTKNSCENSWVYVADCVTPSLLIYTLKKNSSWRALDDSFRNKTEFLHFDIAGSKVDIDDGLFALALNPHPDLGHRELFYHSLANDKESRVNTGDLKNSDNFQVPYGQSSLFYTFAKGRNQQSASETFDRNGNLYFSHLHSVQILRWDSKRLYRPDNFEVVASNKETMQFPSGLKVSPYKHSKTEALWLFSTAYQRYYTQNLNGSVTNFRLFFLEL
ncbi:dopaminechrome tautomerase-like isoform X1 [Euwallacea similis]|uniref:dopaminechrome tautomerase-like isoform X1 n=1 Tax=Euwallacea similis TaxID=1736056 RepID=UPI00344F3A40